MNKRYKWQDDFRYVAEEPIKNVDFSVLDQYIWGDYPFWVRRNSMDETIVENIFTEECYHPNLWFNRNLREEFFLKDVEYILDIGANIGAASRYYAHMFPDAKIFSLEPEATNYNILLKNTSEFQNIKVFHQAIWNNNDGVYINNRDKIYGHSGKANPAKYTVGNDNVNGEELVKSSTIHDFIQSNQIPRVDILKMDIQGAEIEAFEDARLWMPYIRLLFIETHDLFRRGCSQKVFREISKFGDFVFVGSPNREILAFLRWEEL